MMICIDEVREMYREALKRGERGAVGNYLGSVVHAAIREALCRQNKNAGLSG